MIASVADGTMREARAQIANLEKQLRAPQTTRSREVTDLVGVLTHCRDLLRKLEALEGVGA